MGAWPERMGGVPHLAALKVATVLTFTDCTEFMAAHFRLNKKTNKVLVVDIKSIQQQVQIVRHHVFYPIKDGCRHVRQPELDLGALDRTHLLTAVPSNSPDSLCWL